MNKEPTCLGKESQLKSNTVTKGDNIRQLAFLPKSSHYKSYFHFNLFVE